MRVGGQLRQVALLDVLAAPAEQRVDDQRVLHVDEHADRRVDPRQRLDRQHRVEEAGAGAAVALGDLDAHDAEVEQLVDERRGQSSPARPFRGRAAGFRGRRTRRRCRGTAVRLRRASSAAGARRVRCAASSRAVLPAGGCYAVRRVTQAVAISRPRSAPSRRVPASRPEKRLRLGMASRMRTRHRCRRCWPSPAARRSAQPASAQQPQQPPRAAQPPAASSRRQQPAQTSRDPASSRRRSSAPASTSSASTSSSPTSKGNPVADLKQSDFEVTEDGKPQKIETFKLVKLDGGLIRLDQGTAARDPHRLRRGDGSGARRRPAVRDLPRRLPRAPRRQPRRSASRSRRFIETQLGPSDMIGVMYPLAVDRVGADDAQSRGGDARAAAVQGPQVRLQPRNEYRGDATRTTRPRSSRRSATRCRSRRSRR